MWWAFWYSHDYSLYNRVAPPYPQPSIYCILPWQHRRMRRARSHPGIHVSPLHSVLTFQILLFHLSRVLPSIWFYCTGSETSTGPTSSVWISTICTTILADLWYLHSAPPHEAAEVCHEWHLGAGKTSLRRWPMGIGHLCSQSTCLAGWGTIGRSGM